MHPIGYRIRVDKPCGEDWWAMTPQGAGRYCAACSRTLVDFSTFTDSELLAYLQKHPGTCGRFATRQLNRPLLFAPAPRPAAVLPKWIAGTLLAAVAQGAAAQHSQLSPELPHCNDSTWATDLRNEGYMPLSFDTTAKEISGNIPDTTTTFPADSTQPDAAAPQDSAVQYMPCIVSHFDTSSFRLILDSTFKYYTYGWTSIETIYDTTGLIRSLPVDTLATPMPVPLQKPPGFPTGAPRKPAGPARIPTRGEPVYAVLPAPARWEEEREEEPD